MKEKEDKYVSSLLTADSIGVYTDVYIGVPDMTTKVFISGNSQAVRIPKEYKVDCPEMEIRKVGTSIILTPLYNGTENSRESRLSALQRIASMVSDDFMAEGRNQPMLNEQGKVDVPS